MRNVHEILLDTEIEAPKNISWAAYHVHRYQRKDIIVSPSALLPLFHENAHSVAMIRHSMDMIRNAVDHINNGQVPVITFDQPLYTVAKQIQWKWPEIYGEEKFVIMLGGLHIEKAALSTVGDWLAERMWMDQCPCTSQSHNSWYSRFLSEGVTYYTHKTCSSDNTCRLIHS